MWAVECVGEVCYQTPARHVQAALHLAPTLFHTCASVPRQIIADPITHPIIRYMMLPYSMTSTTRMGMLSITAGSHST